MADPIPNAITVKVEFPVPLERIVNCIVGFVESPYNPWAHSLIKRDEPKSNEGEGIWYSREKFWWTGGSATLKFDRPTEAEGEGNGEYVVSLKELSEGLALMARKAPSHFADLIQENDDAITHDVFMQMVVLGEIVYG